MTGLRSRIARLRRRGRAAGNGLGNAEYWSKHNVTSHRRFATREESVEYADWRTAQYLFYKELLPLDELAGKVVLDFGCGPGDDLVLITEAAPTARLIGMDVSGPSLREASQRVQLHGVETPALVQTDDQRAALPLRDGSVDFFLSSGVLHHCENVAEILRELHRVLTPGGRGRVMVYNHDSVWMHLYVPYVRQIVQSIDRDLSLTEAFKRSTDGPDCPHSVCYRPADFLALAQQSGFTSTYLGAAVSVHELSLLPHRAAAMQHPDLVEEHREFLEALTFDEHGRPLIRGQVAGIDGFFELRKTGQR